MADVTSIENATVSEQARPVLTPAEMKARAERMARMVIREGKSFLQSAVEAGYSEHIARRGLAALMAQSTVVSDAIKRESVAVSTDVSLLKPAAITRLYREIVDPDSSLGIKAIELAGRLKETDWFVRNGETSVGIFLAVQEGAPAPDTITVSPTYED